MKNEVKRSRFSRGYLAGAVGALIFGAAVQVAQAADTIKVGILHSLSGTMAISETTLKDTMLMLIDEQNKKGGLHGKKLEPVVAFREGQVCRESTHPGSGGFRKTGSNGSQGAMKR